MAGANVLTNLAKIIDEYMMNTKRIKQKTKELQQLCKEQQKEIKKLKKKIEKYEKCDTIKVKGSI